MAQWIEDRGFSIERLPVRISAAAVVPLGKALYPHILVPRRGLTKPVVPRVAYTTVTPSRKAVP